MSLSRTIKDAKEALNLSTISAVTGAQGVDRTIHALCNLICNLFNGPFKDVSLMCAEEHWSRQAQMRDAINGRREDGSFPGTVLVDRFVTVKVH